MTDTLTDSLPDTLPDNTTDKKKTRQDAKVTRLDVRLPNELHATIEAIARANGEPRHHITGNIILTPTVVKLIRLGISSLSGEYRTLADIPTTAGQVSDNLTPRMQAVESEVSILKKQISRLEDKLNGLIVSDNLPVIADRLPDTSTDRPLDLLPNHLADTASDILSDISTDITSDILPDKIADIMTDNNDLNLPDSLADKVSDIKTSPKTKPEGALTISDLTEKLGKTRQAIESARDKGTLGDFGYRAEKQGRNWVYWAVDEDRR